MRGLRVLVVCPYGLKEFGGVANQSKMLTAGLRAARLNAYLAIPCDGRPPPAGIAEWVWDLGRTRAFRGNGTIANVQLLGSRIWKAIDRLRPDLVHLQEPLALGAPLSFFLLGSRHWPTVGTFHRAESDWLHRTGGLLAGRTGWWDRIAARLAVSDVAARAAAKAVGGSSEDYHIVPPAVAPEWFEVPRRSTCGHDGTLTVIYWGRIEGRKGLRHLIDAMGMEEVPSSVRLIVVGGGREAFVEPLKQRAKSQIDNGRIRFLGPLDDIRLRAEVARSDITVSPAEHGESFRSVLAEAMAAGLPVIATELHREGDPVVRDGINGHLVAPADARALARAIGHCACAPDELVRLGAGARETARQLTVERLVTRILGIYHDLPEKHADRTT